MKSLQGTVAIVTGGSRGIGKASCLDLAVNGAQVVVNYLENKEKADQVVQQIIANGGEAIAIQGDVSKKTDMTKLAQQTYEYFGKITCLVNNAGIIRDRLLLEMEEEDWDEVLRVNLKGLYVTTKEVLPYMFGEGASIINLSSIAASVGSKGHVNYAAAKGGVEAFTRALAIEVAANNIRVNAIAPGYIQTEMSDSVMETIQPKKQIPMRRTGKATEVAEVVTFLASTSASYMTGETIKVAGGVH